MYKIIRLSILCIVFLTGGDCIAHAQNSTNGTDTAKHQRLTIGGYGEAIYSYNFYSDNAFRYSKAANFANDKGHGRIDLPHAVIMLGYDFGKGWTLGTEVEFEHGGTEAAVEVEAEEAGEFELEIERGGEVALEQFWIQKEFNRSLNLRMGHIVVPVGMTNKNHTPDQFFTAYRPEGENTIMPCTWHETGVSLWGRLGDWRYEAMVVPALNSKMFSSDGWVHGGSASPYEFRPASRLAVAGRLDYYGISNLRMSVSGYAGNSFNNDIITDRFDSTSQYYNAKGTVLIGAFDFAYKTRRLIVRGNADYGYLSDARIITRQHSVLSSSTASPYSRSRVGQNALSLGLEAGVNLMGHRTDGRSLFLFAHGEYYDSFIPAEGMLDIGWTERTVLSCGINYSPMPEITIKAEAGLRMLTGDANSEIKYNDEPWVAIGITWSGMFKK